MTSTTPAETMSASRSAATLDSRRPSRESTPQSARPPLARTRQKRHGPLASATVFYSRLCCVCTPPSCLSRCEPGSRPPLRHHECGHRALAQTSSELVHQHAERASARASAVPVALARLLGSLLGEVTRRGGRAAGRRIHAATRHCASSRRTGSRGPPPRRLEHLLVHAVDARWLRPGR